MAKADKEYVDLLFHTVTKDITELKERIAIIENQNGVPAVPTEAQSTSVLTITLDDLREIVTTELTLCLKQHQEQVQAEEEALKKKRAEEYALEIAKKREEYKTAGRIFLATAPEWFELIHQTQNAHNENTKDTFKVLAAIGETFNRFLADIQKTSDNILEFVTPPPSDPEPVSIIANLPSGLYAKIKELRIRIKNRLHTYLNGRYSLHRGYTLLIVILYGLMLTIFAMFRISISG